MAGHTPGRRLTAVTGLRGLDRVDDMTRSRLTNIHLGAVAVALAAAFVLLPRPLASAISGHGYGGERELRERVTTAFVRYWHIGHRSVTPELSHLVAYWRWYHVVKAATAIGILVVLIVLGARLWRAYARSGSDTQWGLATGGIVITILSVIAFVLAMANVQGAIAPFSSLMSMLPISSAHGGLTVMIGEVKNELGHYTSSSPGALRMMVGDLALYHVVIVVLAGSAAIVLIAVAVASWRTRARTTPLDRRMRRLLRSFSIASVLTALALAVLALGNYSAVVDSPTAVLNFYRGTF
jgi:hypothetical protein